MEQKIFNYKIISAGTFSDLVLQLENKLKSMGLTLVFEPKDNQEKLFYICDYYKRHVYLENDLGVKFIYLLNFKDLLTQLSTQFSDESIEQINFVMKILLPGVASVRYEFLDYAQVLWKEKIIDESILLDTILYEMSDEKNGEDFVTETLDYLTSEELKFSNELNWKEVFFLILFLELVYSRFNKFTEEQRGVVLRWFSLFSICLNINLKNYLIKYLKTALNPVNFAKLYFEIIENIEISETKLEFLGVSKEKDISNLLKEFSEIKKFDEQEVDSYLAKLSFSVKKHEIVVILKELLTIYISLRNLDLVLLEDLRLEYKDKRDEYREEMTRLMFYFGYGRDLLSEIAKRFLMSNQVVNFRMFLKELQENIDLSEANNADKLIELTDLLHQNNLLPADQEIIAYHEADGKFHWVE